MIPKTLHYIWFGGRKNDLAKKCISSYSKYLRDYKIIGWNEANMDYTGYTDIEMSFFKDSYNKKRYAFCSDLARLHILKKHGGIYVDTDVEFIKSLPDSFLCTPFISRINPQHTVCNGCIWGCDRNDALVSSMLSMYISKLESSVRTHGRGWIFNTLLKEHFASCGDSLNNSEIVNVLDYNIYPTEYFCPINWLTSESCITDNTISIHHFMSSWVK